MGSCVNSFQDDLVKRLQKVDAKTESDNFSKNKTQTAVTIKNDETTHVAKKLRF